MAANLVTIPAKRAFEVIALNKAGEKPLSLIPEGSEKPQPKKDFIDLVGQDSLTRFDKTKRRKRRNRNSQKTEISSPDQRMGNSVRLKPMTAKAEILSPRIKASSLSYNSLRMQHKSRHAATKATTDANNPTNSASSLVSQNSQNSSHSRSLSDASSHTGYCRKSSKAIINHATTHM